MKRLMSLLLVTAMGVLLLAGCGGGADPSAAPDISASPAGSEIPAASDVPASPAAKTPEDIMAGYPKKDMGGYEFVVNCFGPLFTPSDITSPVDEAKDARNRMIEDYFNMKFVLEQKDPGIVFQEASAAILGGDKYADMMAQTMWVTGTFLTNKLLLDLRTVPTLKLDAPYYDQQVIKAATMNGKTYELAGDAEVVYGWAVAFNKKIAEEINVNPYELVRNNEWTLDKYREICRAATQDNGDGVMTNADDRWGHCGPFSDYNIAMANASALPNIGEDENQRMSLQLNTDAWREHLKNLNSLFINDGTYMDKDPGAAWDSILPHWQAGRVMFFGYMTKGIFSISRDMEDDWGIVPMPKATAGQENYAAWVDHNTPMVAMTIANPNPEDAGMIIDAMYQLSSSMVVPVSVETDAGLYLRDDESVEMLNLIRNSSYYDAVYFLRFGLTELHAAVELPINVMMGKKEFASGYEEISGMIQDTLDKFFRQGDYAE